jgi:hypothetical protein
LMGNHSTKGIPGDRGRPASRAVVG